jgi:hypothetical protein
MKTNKLGVKNSLVNNINKRKALGISRAAKKATVAAADYKKLKTGKWK